MDCYILNDDFTTRRVTYDEHLAYLKTNPRTSNNVIKTRVKRGKRSLLVSTVFLWLDHNFQGGEPLIFETMIFGEKNYVEQYCDRYSTVEQARAGHAFAVTVARSRL